MAVNGGGTVSEAHVPYTQLATYQEQRTHHQEAAGQAHEPGDDLGQGGVLRLDAAEPRHRGDGHGGADAELQARGDGHDERLEYGLCGWRKKGGRAEGWVTDTYIYERRTQPPL